MLVFSEILGALVIVFLVWIFGHDILKVKRLKRELVAAAPAFPVKAEIENAEQTFHAAIEEVKRAAEETRVISEEERAELVEERQHTREPISDTQLLRIVREKAAEVTAIVKKATG